MSANYKIGQLRGAWGAGKAAGEKAAKDSASIVGKFFHAPIKGSEGAHWQGHVISEPQPGHFLVQLYSWLTGNETNQQLISFSDMANWNFYGSESEWVKCGDQIMAASVAKAKGEAL